MESNVVYECHKGHYVFRISYSKYFFFVSGFRFVIPITYSTVKHGFSDTKLDGMIQEARNGYLAAQVYNNTYSKMQKFIGKPINQSNLAAMAQAAEPHAEVSLSYYPEFFKEELKSL